MAAAAVYVGGALGVEMLGGAHASAYGLDNFAYKMYQTVEESCELFGTVLFAYALLRYAEAHAPSVTLIIDSADPTASPPPPAETAGRPVRDRASAPSRDMESCDIEDVTP